MSRTERFGIFERTKSVAEHARHFYRRPKAMTLSNWKGGITYTNLLHSVKFNNRIKTVGFILVYFGLALVGSWARESLGLSVSRGN